MQFTTIYLTVTVSHVGCGCETFPGTIASTVDLLAEEIRLVAVSTPEILIKLGFVDRNTIIDRRSLFQMHTVNYAQCQKTNQKPAALPVGGHLHN